MEKKIWLKSLCAFAVAAMMGACSSDNLSGDEPTPSPVHPNDAVYLNITAKLPTATGGRSETMPGEDSTNKPSETLPGGGSNKGTEVGTDDENLIKSMMLVFTDNDFKIIAYGTQDGSATIEQGKTALVNSTQKIDKSTLSAYYGQDGVLTEAEAKVSVWLFCNPTDRLKGIVADAYTSGNKEWINAECEITETPASNSASNAAIWGGPHHKSGFLMTSSKAMTKELPSNFNDWDQHSSPSKAFKLSGKNYEDRGSDGMVDNSGAIPVERSVARFDFRDGSKGNNTYDIVTENDKATLQIQLQRMALVNMSKTFYFVRRVSGDGLPENAKVGGLEYDNGDNDCNYVVSTNAAQKAAETGGMVSNLTFADYYNFCLFNIVNGVAVIDPTARSQWYSSSVDDVLGMTTDNWAGSADNKYHVWRYVTENTLPGPVTNQVNGITTGVVFKGKMIVPQGVTGTIADAINKATGNSATDPILYTYANDIFVTWKEVRAAAIESGKGSDLYTAAFGNPKNEPVAGDAPVYSDDVNSVDYKWNNWHNVNNAATTGNSLADFKKAATGNDFTLYQSSIDDDTHAPGYYCYYYYWNRHNDNGNNGVMGPMEFAVVRNNVYKLSVTNIRRLGHPRITENDPDPVDPDDPDEEGNIYFDVQSETLPWVVRVNNIEF